MTALFVLIAALVILGAALAFTGRWRTGMSATDRAPAPTLPGVGDWTSVDVKNAKFRVGLRGYRMEDVDAALKSLAEQLRLAEDARAECAQANEPERS